MDLPLYRPGPRIPLRRAAWTLWALILISPAGAAEAGTGVDISPGIRRGTPSTMENALLARAETLVPGRTDLPRVAVDWDDRSASPSDGGEDSAPSDQAEVVPAQAPRGTGPGPPAESGSPSRLPEGTPTPSPESPEGNPTGDLSEPVAPGRIVEESIAPVEADDPEAIETDTEFLSAPGETEEGVPSPEASEAVEGFFDSAESETADGPGDGIVPLVEYEEGRVTVRADGEPLGDVLYEIGAAGDIRIQGLNHRADDPLSFQVEDMDVEDALKRLMRHLKESNYAFEYSRTRLRRLSVFPAGRTEAARPTPAPRPQSGAAAEGGERVVRVINVHEGTQAENLDLRQGDLIVEYDGEPVDSAQELVDAVKARSAEQIVQMTVVRDGNRFPLTLNGGLIGVNILTVSVPPDQVGR